MTIDSSHSTLGTGISFALSVPFAWRVASGELTAQQCEENEQLLRLILALEEYPAEHSEELAALDLKLNIIMELLGDLLTHQLDLPAVVSLRLGATELVWTEAGKLPAVGEYIEISIYLHRTIPRPLLLCGQVTAVDSEHCHVQLDALPEGLQDMFEKYIFTHHRREVAHARHSQP